MDNKETLINHIEDKVPKLRFPGFTEPWEQRKLGDVLVLLKDGTHGTHNDAESGPLLLSAKNIKNGTVQWDESDRRISKEDYNSIHSNFKLQKGDVLLTIVGSIGETAILSQSEEVTFQRSVAFLRPSDEISSEFLYSEIQGQKFQKELNDRKSTSAQPGIYLGDLGAIPIVYPISCEEQIQIGNYFSSLDHLITLHQNKLNILNKYKRGLISLTFSNKNCCKEFKLKELLQPYTSKNTSLYEPVAVGKYGIRKRSEIYSKILSKDISKNKVIEKNTFVIGMGSKQIDFGILYEDIKYSVSPAYLTFKISKKINPKYLEEYLRNILPILSFKFMIIGARQGKNIDKEGFLNYSIYVPSIDRQNRISDTLIALDKKIEKENELLLLLKQYKQGLLQQMFI